MPMVQNAKEKSIEIAVRWDREEEEKDKRERSQ